MINRIIMILIIVIFIVLITVYTKKDSFIFISTVTILILRIVHIILFGVMINHLQNQDLFESIINIMDISRYAIYALLIILSAFLIYKTLSDKVKNTIT